MLGLGIESRKVLLVAVLLPLAALGAAAVSVGIYRWPTRPALDRLKVPSAIDVGPINSGTMKAVRIELENPGQRGVTLTEFHASCSCMTVYQESPSSSKVAVEQVRIGPLASASVLVDILPGGDAGSRQASAVAFRDAETKENYSVAIFFTPIASLYAIPKAVAFGELTVGERAAMRVEVRSHARVENDAVRVAGEGLKYVSTNFVIASSEQVSEFDAALPGQHLVGYLDVTLNSGIRPARVGENVLVFRDDSTKLEIPVSAEVVGPYSLIPRQVVLPRRSSSGASRSAHIVCRSRLPGSFTIAINSNMAPFRATTEQPSDLHPDRAFVDLEYQGALPKDRPKDYELTLKITGAGREYALSCPIRVLAAPP